MRDLCGKCFGGTFVLVGLGIAAYGAVKLVEINKTEFRSTTCELVQQSGPHFVPCDGSSDSGIDSTDGRRLLELNFKSCGDSYCTYTMRSDLTGNDQFDAEGDANASSCTEFLGTANHIACYALFREGKATGLALQTKGESSTIPIVFMILGIFCACGCCCAMLTNCGESLPAVCPKGQTQSVPQRSDPVCVGNLLSSKV